MKAIAIFLISLSPAVAGELAVLSSGAKMRVERHALDGAHMRLVTNGGEIVLPADQVAGFETEEYVPPQAPPAPAAAVLAKPMPASAQSPRELVDAAAKKYGLPASFVRSIVKAESGFQPAAISPKGAIGLMQLMPGTAAQYGIDAKDPRQNVEAGTKYLRDLLVKYENDPYQVRKAVAAYNAGPGAVDKYHGIPPYAETQNYVGKVIRDYTRQKSNGDSN